LFHKLSSLYSSYFLCNKKILTLYNYSNQLTITPLAVINLALNQQAPLRNFTSAPEVALNNIEDSLNNLQLNETGIVVSVGDGQSLSRFPLRRFRGGTLSRYSFSTVNRRWEVSDAFS